MIVILVMIKIKYHVSKLNTKKSLGTLYLLCELFVNFSDWFYIFIDFYFEKFF